MPREYDAPPPGGGEDALFRGAGEMRALCRALDWSSTPLGASAAWPVSLRTTVATLLASRHPMFLFWGPDLVQIYNDAYRVSLGDGGLHPRALGMRGAAFWTEIWHIIGPQIAQVMRGGDATWHEDHLVPILRNGRVEDVYWTYSYGPAYEDDGRVGGVLVVCQETTTRVRTELAVRAAEGRQRFLLTLNDRLRALADPGEIQFEAARALGEHLGLNRVGYGEVEADGAHTSVTRNYTDGVAALEGRYRVADYSPTLLDGLRAGRTVSRDDLAGDATLSEAERAAHAALGIGATVDVGLVKDGRLVATMFMHRRAAHAWRPEEITLLQAVAERTWDAAERARAEAALRRVVGDLEAVLRVVPVGIGIARDPECRDIRVNPTFARLLGVDASVNASKSADPDALPFRVLSNGVEVAADDLPIQRAAREGQAVLDLELDLVRADGGVSRLLEYAAPLLDERGAARGAVGVIVDITERARLVDAERAARAEAEAANRAKSQFLATMSHELRTPLNAIQGYTELIELGIHGPVTDGQRDALGRIQTSQRHLLGLINEVLNYARLETGTVRYDIADVPIADVIAVVESLVLPQAQARALVLELVACAPDVTVRADREKVQQILVNLLSNAIKNTDRGGRIEVSCARAGDRTLVRVTDTGIGIAADKHESIFEPFVQVGRTLSSPSEGVGLGLAISRDLARAMGGDLSVESREGAGSTFTLALPRADGPGA